MEILMVKMKATFVPILFFSFIVCGCQHPSESERAGEVVGGASGALLGAQIGAGTGQLVGVGVGAIVGALVGGTIAHDTANNHTDTKSKKQIAPSPKSQGIVPSPVSQTHVKSPQSKSTKHAAWIKKNGRNRCYREYTHQGVIDGKPVTIHGTAHMNADGTWYVPDCPHAK